MLNAFCSHVTRDTLWGKLRLNSFSAYVVTPLLGTGTSKFVIKYMAAAPAGQQGHFWFMGLYVVWWGKHNYQVPWEMAVLMWPGILPEVFTQHPFYQYKWVKQKKRNTFCCFYTARKLILLCVAHNDCFVSTNYSKEEANSDDSSVNRIKF